MQAIRALLRVDPVEAQKQGIPLDYFDETKNHGDQFLRFRMERDRRKTQMRLSD